MKRNTRSSTRSRSKASKADRIASLWLLQIKGDPKGRFVGAIDSVGDPIVCYRNKRDADDAAAHTAQQHQIACEPVRIDAYPHRQRTHQRA